MNDIDLNLFKFDYDLTWMGFFLNAENHIFSRYGGRDAASDEGRLSIAGLKTTMRRVLDKHRQAGNDSSPAKLPQAHFNTNSKRCLHCHEVWEGLRQQQYAAGTFNAEVLDVYPLPENVGLALDVDAGNRVTLVIPGTAAAKAGLRVGDEIRVVGDVETISQSDIQWALHNASPKGRLRIEFRRAGSDKQATLYLSPGWRMTDRSWRKSMSVDAEYLK